ncbi:hypothetical protein [Gordonia phthalatica]|uniref:hypothetical protein n=1 Tax=Gordonia phthalatica TaxID=1136941 RepID=UPI00078229DA
MTTLQHSRSVRRLATRTVVGVVGAGAAVALAVPAQSAALPDLSSLPNSSAELNLPDLINRLPDLIAPKAPPAANGKSSCTAVIQIGDSTSVNADSASLPGADATAGAQYRRVGAATTTVDALAGRAIVGGPGTDAADAVAARTAAGERGCWVIAMGVNDAGAIATGGESADQRIDRIMSKLTGQPVLWPTIASSNPKDQAFGSTSMTAFNDALKRATTRYPNLAVYDWAAAARPEMFAGDGIHYTAAATAERNKRFADALATAYPAGSGSTPTVKLVG